MPSFAILPDYNRIKLVTSFQELIATPFCDGINALCWPRTLPGNFSELMEHMPAHDPEGEGMIPLDDSWLTSLKASVSAAARTAIDFLLEDQRLLREAGLAPILDCIHAYPRDAEAEIVPVHVMSFHVDSATTEADTWLCTYHGAPSEGLPNEQAIRRIDISDTRAALLEAYGGEDDADFLEHLQENCYDLHYAPLPGAQPYTFGISNLWRIATQYPGSPVPPCIHRAPETDPTSPPRLLLIS